MGSLVLLLSLSEEMSKTRQSLKILLVQIRKDRSMTEAERSEFILFSGLHESQFLTLDVFRNPDFTVDLLEQVDALMIGGLSDDDNDQIALPDSFTPFITNLNNLMSRAIELKIPSLLSCGGFMLASMLLGAKVVVDPTQKELDVVDIYLTDEAETDKLFRDFPGNFKAVSGHIKSSIDLPESCIHLAYSTRCQVHGFRVKDAPFYAFQFHPEVTCQDLKARVVAYKDKYFESEKAYQDFINKNCDTSVANSIVRRFVEMVYEGINFSKDYHY